MDVPLMRILQRLFVFLILCAVSVANAADPVISEFMADNTATLADENGDWSDWIEIHNPDPNPVNLAGWYLTDTAGNKRAWRFPSVTLPGKGYLIVFASGKDRAVAGQPLHTNFKLSSGGEYLALVKPDGITATTEFSPQFPIQSADISYGQARAVQTLLLMDKGSPARAFVPADNSLGTNWRSLGFDDASWQSGTLGAGYFTSSSNPNLSSDVGLPVTMLNVNSTMYVRCPFVLPAGTIQRLILRINYDDGFAAFLNGQFATSSEAPSVASLTYNSRALANHGPATVEDFDITSSAGVLASGTNILALHGLNRESNSSDCFLLPQLIAEVETNQTPQIGYFSTATPGQANGGNDTLRLPQLVAFSRPSGTFTTGFDLTLSGAVQGQQIRYTIGDPSTSVGATLVEPTATSTLYTAPITISSSKLIRAAIFDSTSGQKGRPVTAQFLLLETGGTNNTSNFTSNLPILVADDHGKGEPVDSGTGNFTNSLVYLFPPVNGVASLNSVPTSFTRAGVRIRGSSSAGFPKKSYGLELWDEQDRDFDQPLLGLAADSDWILNGPYQYDDTFIHNAFIYAISRQVGRWAPRTAFVEMFFNQNGGKLDYSDYAGIYVLTEKIKSTGDRLDITSLQPNENAGDALTGGYIFKIDRADFGEFSWTTTNGVPNSESAQDLVVVEPDTDVDTPGQIAYLQGYVQAFDTALFNERASGFATRNYQNYIDVLSWVDHHILNTLAYNADGLRLSAFFFKDRLGKINAGPLWDFDRALGSDDGRDATPQSWANIGYYFTRDWWGQLFRDPDFVQAWIDRWWQLRAAGQPLATTNLNSVADGMGAQIGNAAGLRDAQKWPPNAASSNVYLNEITAMKSWMGQRVSFIDSRAPGPATANLASGVVNSGASVTLSGTGTLRYTIDGKDPRPAGGGTVSSALTYTAPLTIQTTRVLTVRRQLAGTQVLDPAASITTNWSAPLTRVYLVDEVFATAGDLGISEINYHPLEPTVAELAALPGVTAEDFEWIELRNIGTRRVNLFELRFPEGEPFTALALSPVSLAPGDFALVVRNRAAFELRYGTAFSAKIAGEWRSGSLADSGEVIRILDRTGAEIVNFEYGDSGDWPGRADGSGSTIEYVGLSFSNDHLADPLNWRSSSEIGGTPGSSGLGADNRVVINEILSHSNSPRVDAIELFNTTATAIDISGWWISDAGDIGSSDSFKKYRIPNNTILQPGAYVVFTEVQFNPNGPWNPNAGTPGASEFAFDSNHGDDAWLVEADAAGKPLRIVDHVDFGASRADESWGRWPNGEGKLYPMLTRTLLNEESAATPKPGQGAANSLPRVGPVLISEIMHSPIGNNVEREFVEIRNTGSTTESLNQWKLRGEVNFDFTDAHSLAPGAVLVIVSFSPADSGRAESFRNEYGIPSSIPLAGPWTPGQRIGNSGIVTLYRAQTPPIAEPGFYPSTMEDQVSYSSVPPWPNASGGISLNRRGIASPSDSSSAWKAEPPSPGFVGLNYALWKRFYFPSGGNGSGDNEDFDGDGFGNASEYGLGTHPRIGDPTSVGPIFRRQIVSGTDSWTFTFTELLNRPSALYQGQKSPDLIQWENVPAEVITTGPDTRLLRITVPFDPSVTNLFFRLRVNIQP